MEIGDKIILLNNEKTTPYNDNLLDKFKNGEVLHVIYIFYDNSRFLVSKDFIKTGNIHSTKELICVINKQINSFNDDYYLFENKIPKIEINLEDLDKDCLLKKYLES